MLAAIVLWVAAVQLGLIRSPFAPELKGDIALARADRDGLRVLFVGNSFTFANGMPGLVKRLAHADEGKHPLFVVEYAAPGWSLRDAAKDDGLTRLLRDVRWDVVVLQEQSQIPSFRLEDRRQQMYPYARILHGQINAVGAETVLFMTWGYREGDRDNWPEDTYAGMQARLRQGYSDLGAELPARVAPVGAAWAAALRHRPGLELWADDGRHPSRLGSYLTACVFYAFLSSRDPSRSEFAGGHEPSLARFLRRIAAEAALD